MKRTFTLLLCAAALGTASAQPADTQYYKSASPVEVDRELPRTRTISYDSEQAALNRSRSVSKYLQPLRDDAETATLDAGKTTVIIKRFTMPFAWIDRQLFLNIGQIDGAYEVSVNGKFAGYNQNGMVPAEFDITKFAKEDANQVQIKIFREPAAAVLVKREGDAVPAMLAESYVVAQPRVRIRDFVLSTHFEGEETTLQLGVVLKTHLLNPKDFRVHYKLLSPSGQEVSSAYRDVEIEHKSEDTVRFFMNIPDARPWTHEVPNLYTLVLKTQHEGKYTEYVSYKIGLGNVAMSDGKLLINGRETPYSVAEFSLRADSAATAAGLQKLKKEGYNMVKVSGYPQPEYFYGICDAIGLYVCNQADINTGRWGESRAVDGNPTNDPAWKDAYADRAKTMYYASRNHPSVIMFSIADQSANGYNLYESYLEMKGREKARPIVYFGAGGEWDTDVVPSSMAAGDPVTAGGRVGFDVARNDQVGTGPGVELVMSQEQGKYSVRNNAKLADFFGSVVYTVKQGAKKVAQGSLPVRVAPQSSVEVVIPTGTAKPGKKLKYEVDLQNR